MRVFHKVKMFFLKFFTKSQINSNDRTINNRFLTNIDKLNNKGMVKIYKGGIQALENELYKKNQIVYIMVIQEIKKDSEKNINFKKWFKNL